MTYTHSVSRPFSVMLYYFLLQKFQTGFKLATIKWPRTVRPVQIKSNNVIYQETKDLPTMIIRWDLFSSVQHAAPANTARYMLDARERSLAIGEVLWTKEDLTPMFEHRRSWLFCTCISIFWNWTGHSKEQLSVALVLDHIIRCLSVTSTPWLG